MWGDMLDARRVRFAIRAYDPGTPVLRRPPLDFSAAELPLALLGARHSALGAPGGGYWARAKGLAAGTFAHLVDLGGVEGGRSNGRPPSGRHQARWRLTYRRSSRHDSLRGGHVRLG